MIINKVWSNFTLIQKICIPLVAIIIITVIISAFYFQLHNNTSLVSIIDVPIKDENLLNKILVRLNEENVRVTVTPEGIIQVEDEVIARKMRAILIREDLIHSEIDTWEVFTERWTLTEFERNIRLQRKNTQTITNLLKSIDGVEDATVIITYPKFILKELEDINPILAILLITPKNDSDITRNQDKINGIIEIILSTVEGLKKENIAIIDRYGFIINNLDNMKNIIR